MMTSDAGASRAGAARGNALLPLLAVFGVLVELTACELVVSGLAAAYATRIAVLAGLLAAKVGLVLTFFMRARASWRASRFVFLSIAFAASVALVLVLETLFRASVH